MSLRPMPSVVKLSTWVSPRWNSPEPWAVGITPTRLISGRSWLVARPSMRTPSVTMRLRTASLVTERTALLTCLATAGSSPKRASISAAISAASVASASWRSVLSAIVCTAAMRSSAPPRTASRISSLWSTTSGGCILATGPTASIICCWSSIISRIQVLAASRPPASTSSSTLGVPF